LFTTDLTGASTSKKFKESGVVIIGVFYQQELAMLSYRRQ
jgi:hypothetical protein